MNTFINIESIPPCFNASSSVLAWATADGRLRLYHAHGQRNVTDIDTLGLQSSLVGHNGSSGSHVYSCLVWGREVCRLIDVMIDDCNA